MLPPWPLIREQGGAGSQHVVKYSNGSQTNANSVHFNGDILIAPDLCVHASVCPFETPGLIHGVDNFFGHISHWGGQPTLKDIE